MNDFLMNRCEIVDFDDDSWYNKFAMQDNRLDEVDRQIVAALKEDGRMSFAEMARRLDVSPGMVRDRYTRLIGSGVLQVIAAVSPTRAGYRSMALIGVKVDGSRLREIANQIAAFEEVVYLVLCTGTYDLLVEVFCVDNSDLLRFLMEQLHAVDGVHDTEIFAYLDIVKVNYSWKLPEATVEASVS